MEPCAGAWHCTRQRFVWNPRSRARRPGLRRRPAGDAESDPERRTPQHAAVRRECTAGPAPARREEKMRETMSPKAGSWTGSDAAKASRVSDIGSPRASRGAILPTGRAAQRPSVAPRGNRLPRLGRSQPDAPTGRSPRRPVPSPPRADAAARRARSGRRRAGTGHRRPAADRPVVDRRGGRGRVLLRLHPGPGARLRAARDGLHVGVAARDGVLEGDGPGRRGELQANGGQARRDSGGADERDAERSDRAGRRRERHRGEGGDDGTGRHPADLHGHRHAP